MVAVLASAVIFIGVIFCMHWFAQFMVDFFGSAVVKFRSRQFADAAWMLYFGICMAVGMVLVVAFGIALSGLFLGIL